MFISVLVFIDWLLALIALDLSLGYKRFENDIFTMIGSYPSIFYKATWFVVSPITLVVSYYR